MTDNTPQTQRDLIEYRFDEVFKRLDRMESKMNDFAFVKQSEFESYKKEVKETYATKESMDPIRTGFYKFVGIVVSAVLLAVLGLVLVK